MANDEFRIKAEALINKDAAPRSTFVMGHSVFDIPHRLLPFRLSSKSHAATFRRMKLPTNSPVPCRYLIPLLFAVSVAASAAPGWQERADQFLDLVNAAYQGLYRVNSEAQWDAATDVTPAHDAASEAAGKAMAAFNGNPAVIRETKMLLEHRGELGPLTVLQLERALLNAAEGPMTNPVLVNARIATETQQASTLNSFTF